MTAHYPSGWSVELATLEDLTNVQSVLTDRCRWMSQRQISQWPPSGFSNETIERAIDEEIVYLARVGKEIVGTFTLREADDALWLDYPGSALYVSRMATHSSWGGRDIGGAMLAWVGQRAVDDARSFVRLHCVLNDGALPAYFESKGFNKVAQTEQDRVDVVLMERPAE